MYSLMRRNGQTLAITASMSSIVDWKKGHLAYISLSLGRFPASTSALSENPTPNHTGKCTRAWVHANIHGTVSKET
jgi:hypothetical protein